MYVYQYINMNLCASLSPVWIPQKQVYPSFSVVDFFVVIVCLLLLFWGAGFLCVTALAVLELAV